MAGTATATLDKPAWVELSSPDAAASRDFYARLFGWQIDVSPDPQYGGYGMAKIGGDDAAGIGPTGACTSAPMTSTHWRSASRRRAAWSLPSRSMWATRGGWRSSRTRSAPA